MTDLPRRALGRTGFDATVLSYGAMEMNGNPVRGPHHRGGSRPRPQLGARRGINLIDTAGCYGLSEERIGRHIGHRRDEYFLASKCGCVPGTFTAPSTSTQPRTSRQRRAEPGLLQTDHLDLVQFHNSLAPAAFDAEVV